MDLWTIGPIERRYLKIIGIACHIHHDTLLMDICDISV